MTGPEHPLMQKLSDLSDADLQNKISDLNTKMTYAYRLNNQGMINQLKMLLDSHNYEYQQRLRKKLSSDKDLKGKIDIAK